MEPLAAVAVRVTTVPLEYGSEQSDPQVIPGGVLVTVPLPVPDLVTVRVNLGTVEFTTRLKLVVRPSGLPVTGMGYVPAGVETLVVMVKVLEQVGLHGLLVKLALAPEGKPETLRVTGWVVPDTNVRVIVFDPDPPWVTVMGPELDKEYSKRKLRLMGPVSADRVLLFSLLSVTCPKSSIIAPRYQVPGVRNDGTPTGLVHVCDVPAANTEKLQNHPE